MTQLDAAAGVSDDISDTSSESVGVDLPTLGSVEAPSQPVSQLADMLLGLRPTQARRNLPRYASLFTALRWAALLPALTLALFDHTGDRAAASGAVLAAGTLLLSLKPVDYERRSWLADAFLLIEVSVNVAAVEATGLGRSPFLITLAVATLIAGFAGGLRIVSGLGVIAGLSVALPSILIVQYRTTVDASVQFATVFVLLGVVGGYSRHLVDDAGRLGKGLAERVDHLSRVNDLLFDLHSAAEHVATPLDVKGATAWGLDRLDEAFSPDLSAILLREPTSGEWRIGAVKGLSRAKKDDAFAMPVPLALVARGYEPVLLESLEHGIGLHSRWGLYCPLRTKNDLVGLLAVETDDVRSRSEADKRTMAEIADATALAVDNARRLERLHTLAVEQERSRLARELHDHVGQSIVYLGFEIERLAGESGEERIQDDLRALRGDLRTLVEELRDMLVDLRTDVNEDQDLDAVLRPFVERVNRRGRVVVTFASDSRTRLPVAVEREVWRVAREAVLNAERHARASFVSVLWLCNDAMALLEVSDDGVGMAAGTGESSYRYGLIGMRERADAIGAKLEIASAPGKGTVVRMRVKAA
jgi:signal transduction histidine kinase